MSQTVRGYLTYVYNNKIE